MAAADPMTDVDTIDALGQVTETGVHGAARAAALSRLRQMGLPRRRDEYWKYTRPDALLAEVGTLAKVPETTPLLDGLQAIAFAGDQPGDLPSIAGARIDTLASLSETDIHWSKDLFGAVEARGHNRVDRPLATLNTAFATDGVLIHVSEAVEAPLSLTYQAADGGDVRLHHVIKVDAGASLTLLEDGLAGARVNTVMEVHLGQGASLRHVRLQGDAPDRVVATHIFVELEEGASFKSFTAAKNGTLTRNEAVLTLNGDNGSAHVAGVVLADGAAHHDDTVFVTHDAVDCESRQVFKKVLRNGATGVFQGKILVEPDAQKTDGYQISQSLLLDDDSQFLAKPELEIYADDVACSHGSTSGAIDEEALFYLRARGVPKAKAENLLTLSFLAEAVEEIDDEALEEAVLERLAGWLEG